MQSDKKLITRMKSGDKNALRTLYMRHKDFLLTLANALLHDIALAEDVLHDVFVDFTRNIGSFQLTGSLKAYLATCIVNRSKSLLRKRKNHADSTDFTVEPVAGEVACPVELLDTAERVQTHLASLPDKQREVVVLRIKAGLKFKEIAEMQKVPIGTVQGRYSYGMDKLRSLLIGEFEQ